MGGLLPSWEGFVDKSNGIFKPSDVAHHWDNVGMHSGMSINGDIWLEAPLSSSYPPSIAVIAMQNQDEDLAYRFLHKIREMVFLEKKNITKELSLIGSCTILWW
jgi:predicted DsbA family dithiol-disulfide isomerase